MNTFKDIRERIGSIDRLNLSDLTFIFKDKALLGYAYLSCFSSNYMLLENAIEAFSETKNVMGLGCCLNIASSYNLPVFYYQAFKALYGLTKSYDEWYGSIGNKLFPLPDLKKFVPCKNFNALDWCKKHGFNLVDKLQNFSDGVDQRAEVLLIQDKDGKFKVVKEVIDYRLGPLKNMLNEDEILFKMPHFDFIPRYYGRIEDPEMPFFKRSFMYGHTLSKCKGSFCKEDVLCLIGRLAKKLKLLLDESGLLFLDLRPENIILQNEGEGFVDLGMSQFLPKDKTSLRVLMSYPRYVAPETGLYLMASEQSIVFQLGIIAHELLTGNHPCDFFPGQYQDGDWVKDSLRYLWPMIFSDNLMIDPSLGFVSNMLEIRPEHRPSLQDCIYQLGGNSKKFFPRMVTKIPKSKGNTVLFPARMGIPHKGHIDYMTRILDLGYKLIISIQRSYSITDRDPIPKWLVMKMVAKSLIAYGYPEESFKIVLTPLYATKSLVRMHFSMMPGMEDVVAIASNNPSVMDLFENYAFISQEDVFGFDEEHFEVQSWGEKFRTSVKSNDYETFQKYAAIGVEQILPFEKLKEMYLKDHRETPLEKIMVCLLDGEKVHSTRVSKYSGPEQSLIKYLIAQGKKISILDFYASETQILLDDKPRSIHYLNIEYCGNEAKIFFKLV